MPAKSQDRIVRRKADQTPPAGLETLDRIEAMPDEAIDLSEIPDTSRSARLIRDESGRLPRRSAIRDAVAGVAAERGLSTYALWKQARAYCPTISESAVGEFLRGTRSIGLDYAEALLAATGLAVVPRDGNPPPPEA